MITAHLTETEIQLYVAEPKEIPEELKAHVQGCPVCQSKVDNYALLFRSIHNAPKPAFDFDLSALVMEQLPVPKSTFPWAAILISILSFSLVAVSAVFFWSSMIEVVKSISGILLAIAATGASVILVFQGFEMLKEHQKRMNTLLTQKTLQL
ncbi:hypothetical protein ACSX1A_09730 [Pontibacter sp. MBLB2868]|uniref:hypothetical protein n=1 Tax=Pontibacter sp. MBLB2868 TaxID=3451555 RepID=UPI003F75042A